MPTFPSRSSAKSRHRWYLQINGKRINLGPCRDKACRLSHEIMGDPEKLVAAPVGFGEVARALCQNAFE